MLVQPSGFCGSASVIFSNAAAAALGPMTLCVRRLRRSFPDRTVAPGECFLNMRCCTNRQPKSAPEQNQITRKLATSKLANWILCVCHVPPSFLLCLSNLFGLVLLGSCFLSQVHRPRVPYCRESSRMRKGVRFKTRRRDHGAWALGRARNWYRDGRDPRHRRDHQSGNRLQQLPHAERRRSRRRARGVASPTFCAARAHCRRSSSVMPAARSRPRRRGRASRRSPRTTPSAAVRHGAATRRARFR